MKIMHKGHRSYNWNEQSFDLWCFEHKLQSQPHIT